MKSIESRTVVKVYGSNRDLISRAAAVNIGKGALAGDPLGIYMPAAKRGQTALLNPDTAPTVSDLKRRKIITMWTEKDETGLSLDGAMLHIVVA